jgi:hypothetical protein
LRAGRTQIGVLAPTPGLPGRVEAVRRAAFQSRDGRRGSRSAPQRGSAEAARAQEARAAEQGGGGLANGEDRVEIFVAGEHLGFRPLDDGRPRSEIHDRDVAVLDCRSEDRGRRRQRDRNQIRTQDLDSVDIVVAREVPGRRERVGREERSERARFPFSSTSTASMFSSTLSKWAFPSK